MPLSAECFGYHQADLLNSNNIPTQIIAIYIISITIGNFTITDIIASKKLSDTFIFFKRY